MDLQKVKSLFFFLVLAALLFYFGHTIARESGSAGYSEQSARFLGIVAVLDTIQFDLDFVNSLGDTSIKTDVFVPSLSRGDSGRDNPFMKSNPSASFTSFSDIPTDFDVLADPGDVFEQAPPPLDSAPLSQPPPEDLIPVSLEIPEAPPSEQQEDEPAPPPPLPPASASLTR